MLQALELQHIRSYDDGLFEFAPGVNIIVGPNASGKTNLLEAIHMSAQGSGFKSGDEDMVARGSQWGRIDATYDTHLRTVKLRLEPTAKSFIVDDLEKKRLPAELILPIVLFEPGHMLLVGGEPERRRNYIDGILTQVEPGFKKLLNSYKRTLLQRNRLLKHEYVVPEHIFVWDLRLSELAGLVAAKRAAYIDLVNEMLVGSYRSVSGNNEQLQAIYESKFPIDGYTQAHLQKLKSDFLLDRARGFTGSGPHREDVRIVIDGADASLSASRGETRSIILALKIVELAIVREKGPVAPMLLLDDVFSELDGKRRRMLAQTLQHTQTFITTTDADAIVKSFMQNYNVITMD